MISRWSSCEGAWQFKAASSEGLLQRTEAKDAPLTLPLTHVGVHHPRERLTIADKDFYAAQRGELSTLECYPAPLGLRVPQPYNLKAFSSLRNGVGFRAGFQPSSVTPPSWFGVPRGDPVRKLLSIGPGYETSGTLHG